MRTGLSLASPSPSSRPTSRRRHRIMSSPCPPAAMNSGMRGSCCWGCCGQSRRALAHLAKSVLPQSINQRIFTDVVICKGRRNQANEDYNYIYRQYRQYRVIEKRISILQRSIVKCVCILPPMSITSNSILAGTDS